MNGTKFHLHDITLIEGESEFCAYFEGKDKKTEKIGSVCVCDYDKPDDDYIEVSYDDMEWYGYIQGGNIQAH